MDQEVSFDNVNDASVPALFPPPPSSLVYVVNATLTSASPSVSWTPDITTYTIQSLGPYDNPCDAPGGCTTNGLGAFHRFEVELVPFALGASASHRLQLPPVGLSLLAVLLSPPPHDEAGDVVLEFLWTCALPKGGATMVNALITSLSAPSLSAKPFFAQLFQNHAPVVIVWRKIGSTGLGEEG